MAASPERPKLLLASEFCQSHEPTSCPVKISLLSSFPKRKRQRWDAGATVYVSHDMLINLSMRQWDVAWLKSFQFGDAVPVVLGIASNEMMEKNESLCDDVIFVPPTLAASVGCTSQNKTSCGSLTSNRKPIRKASTVHARLLGRPISQNPFLRLSDKDQNPARTLQQCCNKRLVSMSMLISARSPFTGELYFCEVTGIDQASKQTNMSEGADIYEVGPGTKWKISTLDRSGLLVPRLPCLSLTERYHLSTIAESSELKSLEGGYHPSLDDTVRALSIPANAKPSQRIVHMIGTEENHAGVCVEAAADRLGMRCLDVRGLAAYAHAHGEAVSTGSTMDQINGLKKALEQATECAPCVLHLHDFQDELDQSDEPQRHGQEQRFWSVIVDVLTLKTSPPPVHASRKWWSHSVLVVISTAQHLPPGPMLQNIIQPSLKLQPPNEAYAEQIWGSDYFVEAQPYLLGLSAREIVGLKQLWHLKCRRSGCISENDRVQLLDTCRREVEARKKRITVKIPNIRWEDVGGLAHVRREIVDAIELPLRHADLFPHSGRSGILLYGPPGTGKTLVAKAVATECGLPFLSVKGPELLGSYVGESEANVRETFASARHAAAASTNGKNAAILFFDELDSLAPRRGGVGDGGGVMERVVATLLTELDGRQQIDSFSADKKDVVVFMIGATNRPDLLDPSLLRPGRLDRLVYLGLANTRKQRAQILAAVMRKFKLEGEQDAMALALKVVDDLPPNLTGADFAAIASSALMRSIRRLCDQVETKASQKTRSGATGGVSSGTGDIESVLSTWSEDRLIPVVTMEDIIEASRGIVPSVSAKELADFERLRVQFSTS